MRALFHARSARRDRQSSVDAGARRASAAHAVRNFFPSASCIAHCALPVVAVALTTRMHARAANAAQARMRACISPSNHKWQRTEKGAAHFTKRPCAHLYCRLTAIIHRFDVVSGRAPAEPAGNPKEKDR
jgi:hypothetical protein